MKSTNFIKIAEYNQQKSKKTDFIENRLKSQNFPKPR